MRALPEPAHPSLIQLEKLTLQYRVHVFLPVKVPLAELHLLPLPLRVQVTAVQPALEIPVNVSHDS